MCGGLSSLWVGMLGEKRFGSCWGSSKPLIPISYLWSMQGCWAREGWNFLFILLHWMLFFWKSISSDHDCDCWAVTVTVTVAKTMSVSHQWTVLTIKLSLGAQDSMSLATILMRPDLSMYVMTHSSWLPWMCSICHSPFIISNLIQAKTARRNLLRVHTAFEGWKWGSFQNRSFHLSAVVTDIVNLGWKSLSQ